jgi:hypothetical protein
MQTLKEARQYAYNLIADGKSQYHLLDDYEKSILTGFIINSTERIHIWEYITEADFKNEIPNMFGDWLTTGALNPPEYLLEKLKENALNYASKEAIRILEEQEEEYKFDLKDRINHE